MFQHAVCSSDRSILFYLFSTLFSTLRYSEHSQGVWPNADYIGNPVSSYPALHNKSKYAHQAPFIFRAESQIVHCQSFRGCRSFFFIVDFLKLRMELGTTRWLCKILGLPSLSRQKKLQPNFFLLIPNMMLALVCMNFCSWLLCSMTSLQFFFIICGMACIMRK